MTTVEPIIEVAIIVTLLLFAYRGGWGSAAPLWRPGRGFTLEDPIRFALFAALVLLFGCELGILLM